MSPAREEDDLEDETCFFYWIRLDKKLHKLGELPFVPTDQYKPMLDFEVGISVFACIDSLNHPTYELTRRSSHYEFPALLQSTLNIGNYTMLESCIEIKV